MSGNIFAGYALAVTSPDDKYAMFSADAFAEAAKVTILGMLMVFSVLAILWGVLAIFKLIFAKDTNKSEQKKQAAEPVAAEPAPASSAEADGGELIAVISAAIEAYRASEEGLDSTAAGGFRVVSFRRASSGRPWNSKN